MLRTPILLSLLVASSSTADAQECTASNTVVANVAAIDQAWVWNRYGALQPHGMMYALLHDLRVVKDGVITDEEAQTSSKPGHVILRRDKRPRPLVLRVNRGQCLRVNFTNLLDSSPRDKFQVDAPPARRCRSGDTGPASEGCGEQPAERRAGFHPNGLELAATIESDASFVGANTSSLVPPGATTTYTFVARKEGTYFAYSPAAPTGGDGDGGSIFAGLFGAVHVEPQASVWYRSQLTRAEMDAATATRAGTNHPILDYEKLRILRGNEIRHSDLTAVIDTRKAMIEPMGTGMCVEKDTLNALPVCNDPHKPFREFTVIFHDESGAVQAFDEFDAARQGCDEDDESEACRTARATEQILHSVRDGFAINYGTAGAGAEVLANRNGVGPVRDCPECMVEEFFLTSWAVGDPSMIVDLPANMQRQGGGSVKRPTGTYYPDDPSNVYHSYLNDRVVYRNLHAGPKEHHVFHLHAHQWLQTQHNPKSAYLDSQTIGPGGTYSYEIAYGGSGNRNRTTGDSIFHCHFYPHFAQGMWALWRVHDVFEQGTPLDAGHWKDRRVAVPVSGARALPDGEILTGTPIPGLVPLPGAALAPQPGGIEIVNGQVRRTDDVHPGYPFFVPGLAGHRPPSPPMDTIEDGGLKRHVVESGAVTVDPLVSGTSRSLAKHWQKLKPLYIPEAGTPTEVTAMKFHETPAHATVDSGGNPASFLTNGLAPAPGAPLADPCAAGAPVKRFQAAVFQFDMIFTKKRWHTPQARMLALKDDVMPTKKGDRPPQPLLFRVSSGDCVEFQHSNITPAFFEQDAFQVKTPTDIIGQHIHLVKFDVIASDGGANGFNYEDGTMSHEEVQHRIEAVRLANGCAPGDGPSDACPEARDHPWFGADYKGGRVTVQRWYADPQEMLLPAAGPGCAGAQPCKVDKTLETVFTHDHLGASTHQQAGLYAGLIVEPAGTRWYDTETLEELGTTRADGGPTSWKALVVDPSAPDSARTFREFGLLYQDFHMAYKKGTDTAGAINAPGQVTIDEATPDKLVKWEDRCVKFPHCPEAVSADDIGTMSINYRSEPVASRVRGNSGGQAAGAMGDLTQMFRSIARADSDLNGAPSSYPLVGGVTKPSWPVLTPGMRTHDPFTPLLEVYNEERFRIRLLAGAHEHEHSFALNGVNWQYMAHEPESGLRNFVATALSEHHEIDGLLRIPDAMNPENNGRTRYDHLFKIGASVDDIWYGNWGIMRAYRPQAPQRHLPLLSQVAPASGERAERLRAAFQTRYRAQFTPLDQAAARAAAATLTRLRAQVLAPTAAAGANTAATAAAAAPAPIAEEIADINETFDVVIDRLQQVPADSRGMTAWNYPTVEAFNERFARFLPAASAPLAAQVQRLDDLRAALPKVIDLRPYPGDEADNTPDSSRLAVCPADAPLRIFKVSAIAARTALPARTLIYHRFKPDTLWQPNPRIGPERWEMVHDPTALLYVRDADLAGRQLKPTVKVEPLVLRARAGDCIEVQLTNRLPQKPFDLPGYNTLPNIIQDFNFNQLAVPAHVGLHVQSLRYHIGEADGVNVGFNPSQTVAPSQTRVYRWYAGRLIESGGTVEYQPVEFGVLNLSAADPIKQNSKGLLGALVIEPRYSLWLHDPVPAEPHTSGPALQSRASARIVSWEDPNRPNTLTETPWTFRDLVLVGQNDANFRLSYSTRRRFSVPILLPGWSGPHDRPVRRVSRAMDCAGGTSCPEAQVDREEADSVDSGHRAFNYRSEAPWMRRIHPAAMTLSSTLALPSFNLLSDSLVGAINQTPRFCVAPGEEVRLRTAFPGGHGRNHVLTVHGHNWPEFPFRFDSTRLGANAASSAKGSQDGVGPGSHYNLLFPAGGSRRVEGDYLVRDMYSWGFDGGLWAVVDVSRQCGR